MATGEISLLDADPDLLDGLDPSAAAEARASVTVSVQTLEQGAWRPKRDELESAGGLGLLVLGGFAARRLALGERWCAELLGQGCLLQPTLADGEFAVMPFESRFTVLERMEVAVLDRSALEAICRWPDVVRKLVERSGERSGYIAGHLTLTQFPRIETRLHVLLWHLAERFGRMTPEGAIVRVPLSHELFGGIIAARRPSVTTALGRLEEQGLVLPRARHEWLVRREPEEISAVPSERGEPLAG